MEVRVYRDFECYSGNKVLYCARVECIGVFDFTKTLEVMRSIYGPKIIVVFMCF